MAGANPSRAEWEGPLERGQEMARRSPAVTGNEVRVSQTRIQVEPRTALFALSRYSRLRAFLFALGHEKNPRPTGFFSTKNQRKRSKHHEKQRKDHGKDRRSV